MSLRFRRARLLLLILVFATALGALNQTFLKPAYGVSCPFLSWYLNDILAGCLLLSFAQLLLVLAGLPPLRSRWGFLLILAAGAAWELLPFLIKPEGVFDPWDLPAYLAGAAAGALLFHPKR